mmetsp:Transcript_115298/g.172314  ORF Transcript_115298/g.172314 Transcript_115298/m.172314 type:complete len:158 (+) Transcript_115298:11-484(+)|eukprot:CAMPEP_0117031450 /NCGR_PEP_ID=MMETSP0472-20121206/22600_1 /TAXON_ID=693140 ORGANISM="Tiarina fusus, Strain LIS" /NCGR_SAMPLE_ID=MMETSP0472 /ASSEMBLY_ACC=CAM_ASM_000603 /LENGTH=157 /DNA_ID=CAMNT_0004739771 /DNA_START=11 /DNA_END=484 /DNA_ORIENTATION=+
MEDNTVINNAQKEGEPADQDRGLGKALLIGAGAAVAGVAAYAAYKKTTKKKKKKIKTKKGKTREINCDVLVDEQGNELPGQEFDETGRCINEDEILSSAGKAKDNSNSSADSNPKTQVSSGTPSYLQGIETANSKKGSSNPGQTSCQDKPGYMQGIN